jgi:PhnB protein
MSSTSTYLNFIDKTEEAFHFYQSIFGWEFEWPISRFSDIPPTEGMPPLADTEKNLVMHICLPILGGHKLMGSDVPVSMWLRMNSGNNVHISLHPDSHEETERLFRRLMEGGTIEMPLQNMFWWAYYGSGRDKYGVQWMVNYEWKEILIFSYFGYTTLMTTTHQTSAKILQFSLQTPHTYLADDHEFQNIIREVMEEYVERNQDQKIRMDIQNSQKLKEIDTLFAKNIRSTHHLWICEMPYIKYE